MLFKTLKLDDNIEETRILNFMIAIALVFCPEYPA